MQCLVCVQTEAEQCGVPSKYKPGLCGAPSADPVLRRLLALVLAVVALGQLRSRWSSLVAPSSWLGGAGFRRRRTCRWPSLGPLPRARGHHSGGGVRVGGPSARRRAGSSTIFLPQRFAARRGRVRAHSTRRRRDAVPAVLPRHRRAEGRLHGPARALSFHPYLDGPGSEVRFFTHVTGEGGLERRSASTSVVPVWNTSGRLLHHGTVASTVPNAGGAGGTWTGTQWTYEKSPARLEPPYAPRLARLLVPSAKLVAILQLRRGPTAPFSTTAASAAGAAESRRRRRHRRSIRPAVAVVRTHILNCGTKADHDEKVPKDGQRKQQRGRRRSQRR